MQADQVKAIKESVIVVMGEQKERVGENQFLVSGAWDPLARRFQDGQKHRCLRIDRSTDA